MAYSADVCIPVVFGAGTCPTRFYDRDWLLPMPTWLQPLQHPYAHDIFPGTRDSGVASNWTSPAFVDIFQISVNGHL